MLSPLVKTIEVPCGQQQAFEIFIKEMGSWWPLGKYTTSAIGGAPAKAIRVDARKGGKIVEVGPDDTEYEWGTIRSYQPYEFVSMDFHIPLPNEKVESRSYLELNFVELEDERTRVELTQTNWEAFGKRAKMLRGGYGPGWVEIFEQAYKSACGGNVN